VQARFNDETKLLKLQESKPSTFIKKSVGSVRDNYTIGEILGQGSYGEVRKCTHKATKEERAVKFMSKDAMDQEEMDDFLNEVDVLAEMDHPNIIKLFEFYDEDDRFALITEMSTGGELID
jgi:calcium-dependent protein kinase